LRPGATLYWLVLVMAGAAAAQEPVARFSDSRAGAPIAAPWRAMTLPTLKAPDFSLVDDAGTTVMRLHAKAGAGSLAHRLMLEGSARPLLTWRWKVDRVLEHADLARKDGDDFAARVYVSFEVPASELSFTERARLKLAKLVYGEDLPAAAICYVWDNRHPPGTSVWNAYSSRMRMIVVDTGPGRVGQWVAHTRDVEADYRASFGLAAGKPMPRITGVAVSADTDQTREEVTAWFGDVSLGARP
jgi:hypothetical protein